jgi:tetratricopeptide (TPR) repeat protein
VWLGFVVGGGAILLIGGGLLFSLPSWFDPDKRANQLFVEASQLVHAGQEAEQTSYIEAFRLYQAAQGNLDKITLRYPSSQVAVQLTSGKAKVGAYTLAEFQQTVRQAEMRAEAERDPLACILFVARSMDLAYTLTEIAGRYAKAGQKAKALELLSGALQLAHTILNTGAKASALRGIAEAYIEAGQKAKALELLSDALQLAHTITDTGAKALELHNIAQAYAKAGDYDRALQLATTIEDADRKVQTWVEIIYTQAQDEQNKNSDTKRILHHIIRASTALSDSEAQARLKPEVAILGKWQNSKETVEFFKDGTVNFISDGRPTVGEYKIVDNSHLRIHFLSGFAVLAGPQVWKFAVSENQLTLNLPDGKIVGYGRAK